MKNKKYIWAVVPRTWRIGQLVGLVELFPARALARKRRNYFNSEGFRPYCKVVKFEVIP